MLIAELMNGKEKVTGPKLSNFALHALLTMILPGYSHIHTIHSLHYSREVPG